MKSIERWFAEHEDGEFVCYSRASPYTVIGPAVSRACTLFTTKPFAVTSAIGDVEMSAGFAMIGRYGLPFGADARWIDAFAKKRIVFLGDLDPPDLLIFAWLRERLPASSLEFLGIGDAFLRTLGVRPARASTLQLAPSESEALPLVKHVLPDMEMLVGAACSRCVSHGRKIELEGILSASARPGESIMELMRSKNK